MYSIDKKILQIMVHVFITFITLQPSAAVGGPGEMVTPIEADVQYALQKDGVSDVLGMVVRGEEVTYTMIHL